MEHAGDALLLVLHYPSRPVHDAAVPFVTRPLSIILTPRTIITLAPEGAGPLAALLPVGQPEGEVRVEAGAFMSRLLLTLADEYVRSLEAVDAAVGTLEGSLTRSLRNEEVLELLKYAKSLVYFATGLKGDELVIARLRRDPILHLSAEDADRLEDVMVELRQAIEMAEISENILGQMMDAFASIVSNNLNAVMKVLTSATILISVPTLIVSVYGMNVSLPGAAHAGAFGALMALSVLVTAALAVLFRRRNWF